MSNLKKVKSVSWGGARTKGELTSWFGCMFCHVQFFTLNVHINICFCMGFRHAHLCTNDYPYSYGFSSCKFLYEWLSILFLYGFCHVHLCTNEYPYSYGFSSCTSLYGWLSISLESSHNQRDFVTRRLVQTLFFRGNT